jgi:acyl dehydratase
MASKWFYRVDDKKRGPVGSADLKRLADSGVLKPADLIWKEGLAAWVAASSIKGLFPQAASPSPPPPPPPEPPVARPAAPPAAGLHPQRLAVAIAAAVGGVATFLPWATVPIMGTIDGTVGDGWITLGLFAGVVAAALLGQRSQQMAGLAQLGGGILSTIAGGIGAAKILHFRQMIESMKGDAAPGSLEGPMKGLMANATRLGPGLYVLVIASVAAVIAIVALRSKREAAVPLPLHIQRISLIVLALAGAAGTFMPWMERIDEESAVEGDASRMSAETIMRARATEMVYGDSLRLTLGQPGGKAGSPGTAHSGWFTLALFATTAVLALLGVHRRPLRGMLLVVAVVTPLAAAGLGAAELTKIAPIDERIRAAVLETARENGLGASVPRMDSPVIRTGNGLWVVITAGVGAAAAAAMLGRIGSGEE